MKFLIAAGISKTLIDLSLSVSMFTKGDWKMGLLFLAYALGDAAATMMLLK